MKEYFLSWITILSLYSFNLLEFLFWVTYSASSMNYLGVPNSAQWT